MLAPLRTRRHPVGQSPWWPNWLPDCEIDGHEAIPVLEACQFDEMPQSLYPITRKSAEPNSGSRLLHGYVYDAELKKLAESPSYLTETAARHWGLVTPDFSVYAKMPWSHRVYSTWLGRAVGVYFQCHGVRVVPNIRWSDLRDLEYALCGIAQNSALCISTQSILGNAFSETILCKGLAEIHDQLNPSTVLIYGSTTARIEQSLESFRTVKRYPTYASQRFNKREAR